MVVEEAPAIPRVVGYSILAEQPLCIAWTQQLRAPVLLASMPSQTLRGLSLDLAHPPEGRMW